MALKKMIAHLTSVMSPLPGQVPNSAGGFAWALGDWKRMERFLILGNEGGTYYSSERALTVQNAQAVLRCVAADGPRAVKLILDISDGGRAPKNDPAIFALALCLKRGDDATKAAVREALPKVCRTGTHLFQLAEAVKGLGGWGPAVQKSISAYYTRTPAEKLAYHAIKYQQRNGWSHRDLLRLCHVRPGDAERGAVFRYMVKGWEGDLPAEAPTDASRQLWAFERAKTAPAPADTVRLIRDFNLPREAVRSEHLQDRQVWDTLLFAGEGMPLIALIRNLGKMTSVGLLDKGNAATREVVRRLSDREVLRKARIHPLAVLVALRTYAGGHGVQGKLAWTPVKEITAALDTAFYESFRLLKPTGKRWMLGLDVSASMTCGAIAGLPGITPNVAAGAMAMVAIRTEPDTTVFGFGSKLLRLDITPDMPLEKVCKVMSGLNFGSTNPGLLFEHAIKEKLPVDMFAVYTDNECNQGRQVGTLLTEYRRKTGLPARLAVVGFTATDFTIGDPSDAGTLSVVGFDTAAPQLMADFARGEL